MSYVDEQLLSDEKVQYRAHLHWIIYLIPVVLALFLVLAAAGLVVGAEYAGAVAMFVLAAIPLAWAYITLTTSEFAVTNRRVIIKVGWIRRRTLETMLNKVEGIGVDQSILGRILGFGTITVTGTGGTKEAFTNIADPLEFRRQVQGQVGAADDARGLARLPQAPVIPRTAELRDERECPYCAERILTKARVCKHCNREVAPLAPA